MERVICHDWVSVLPFRVYVCVLESIWLRPGARLWADSDIIHTCELVSSEREREREGKLVSLCSQESVSTSYMCVCLSTQTKCLCPRISFTLQCETRLQLLKKPRAIVLAAVIVSCDYLPSTLSRHILHNPPLKRARRHLISLLIIFQSAGKKIEALL